MVSVWCVVYIIGIMPDEKQVESRPLPALDAHPLETREKAFQLHKRGNKHKDVAEQLDIPRGTVIGWAKRYRWRARLIAESAEVVAATAKTIAPRKLGGQTFAEKQSEYETKMADEALRLPAMMAGLTDKELLASADKIAKLDATNRKALKLESDKPGVVVNVALLSGAAPAPTPSLPNKSCRVDNLLPPIDVLPSVTVG